MPVNQRSAFAKYVGPQNKPVIDGGLLGDLSEIAVRENRACARKVALAAEIWDSCIHQTVQVGDLITDAGNYAGSETAKVLGCSKTVADTFAEIGMDLRLRLPAIKKAFEAGELDLARVRAIYRVTNPLSLDAAHRIETEVLNAARRLSPGPLATEISSIIQRTAPEEMAEVREDLKKLTGVRYRDKDLIATIEANLEAADAAACWQSITEMAATLCPRDPRTRSQRLAAAYIACMQREEYLACTCEVDEDHPCTAKRALPDRRVPLTSITIDLATLAALNDLPAFLAGHGLIDAEYARELTANSDWQIVITEARNVAEELHIPLDHGPVGESQPAGSEPGGNAATGDATADVAATDDAATDDARATDATPDDGFTATGRPKAGNHLTFHPLGRGRRRRGLRMPKPVAGKRFTQRAPRQAGEYSGSYTLIAALEKAIAANPAVAEALYPDGHGGFIEPPDGALHYKPRKELADLVRHRDRTCRFPGCDVPAASCEIDHVVPYFHHDPAHGGWTVLTNLHCLCRYHHSLKTMGAWHPTVLAGAIEYWESNSGSTAVTLPGSTVGTVDLAGETLIPHIPRRRRPKCEIELPDQTLTDPSPQNPDVSDPTSTDLTSSEARQASVGTAAGCAAASVATPVTVVSGTEPAGHAVDPAGAGISGKERADENDPAPF